MCYAAYSFQRQLRYGCSVAFVGQIINCPEVIYKEIAPSRKGDKTSQRLAIIRLKFWQTDFPEFGRSLSGFTVFIKSPYISNFGEINGESWIKELLRNFQFCNCLGAVFPSNYIYPEEGDLIVCSATKYLKFVKSKKINWFSIKREKKSSCVRQLTLQKQTT